MFFKTHSRARALPVAAALATLLLALAGTAQAATPSTHLTVTGAVQAAKTHDLATLSALPAVTQTVSFGSGSGPQTHTFTGASLWGVLNTAGIVTNPSAHNDVLSRYVLATGSDGYKTVYSLGELHPNFGNRPDLVAYAETINGTSAPLGADGFARTTAPQDVKGGRYVSNLINLDVRASGATVASTTGGVSTQFSVTGAVKTAKTYDLQALQALPTLTRTVNGVAYTGVSFWDLLNAGTGLALNPAVKNDVLGKYVVATGSDGYRVVFSLGELSPDFGNQPDMIAFSADGQSLGANGFARLVVGTDVRAGRWVSNLVSLQVMSASPVPEPATLALMLTGMAGLGLLRRTRRA